MQSGYLQALAYAILLGVLGVPLAQAARPLNTDDARTVDADACQVETWIKRTRDAAERWALPACNFTGNLELTLGGARWREADSPSTSVVVLQGKTILKPLTPDGVGVGFALGLQRLNEAGRLLTKPANAYFYAPVSVSFLQDRFVLHTNIGAAQRRELGSTVATWGLGSETLLTERAYLIAEIFGAGRQTPEYQLGLRYWVVKDRWQMDVTYGNRGRGDREARFVSAGMRLLTPPFLR